MSFQAALTLIILIATLLVLATQFLRSDLTALLVTLSLILSGVLDPGEAFSSFGKPVIIIVPSIYVLGTALYETGVATMIANRLVRFSNRGVAILMAVIMLIAGLLSSVLSSMLVVTVLLPAVLRIARRARLAPSQLLLPLTSSAAMGNLLTLIGTISTLIVSDLLVVSGHKPLGFCSVMPYGLLSLLLAILWFVLGGRRLLSQEVPAEPQRPSLDEVEQAYRLEKQLYRLRIRSGSDLISKRLDECELGTTFHLNVVAIRPGRRNMRPASPDWILNHNDVLIVEGARSDALQAAARCHLEPKGPMPLDEFSLIEQETLRLAELMVPFRSQLAGKTLQGIRFRERFGLNVLAVHRQDRAIREDLPTLTLVAGDTLLVQGPVAHLREIGQNLNLILVTQLGPEPGDLITGKAKLTLGILGAMLICVVTGLLPLDTASLAAAVSLILTGCVSLNRAYQSIDGSVIVLVGGMFPLAMALEQTGLAELIASYLVRMGQGVGPLGALLPLYLFTCLITQIIPNSVAAALMTPISINLAVAQGSPVQPFAIAIAVAVTTSYLTPLTNTDNLLIRGPGRYTTRDYLIQGLPLLLLQSAGLVLLLLIL
ncbi:MAG: SLC13 family permease [Anaerolineae bacterium]